MIKHLLLVAFAILFSTTISLCGNSGQEPAHKIFPKEEIATALCSIVWSPAAKSTDGVLSKVFFIKDGTYKCCLSHNGNLIDSIQGIWNIEDNKVSLSFPDFPNEVTTEFEVVDITNNMLVIKIYGEEISFDTKPDAPKTNNEVATINYKPEELEAQLSATKWVVDTYSRWDATISFLKGGAYKLYINYPEKNTDSLLGAWSIDGNNKITLHFPEEKLNVKAEILSITKCSLSIRYNNHENNYRAEAYIPEPTYSASKESIYSKFIGNYNLNPMKGVAYDYMMFRYKEKTEQLECVRVFRLINTTTCTESDEKRVTYEVTELDTVKETITLKYEGNKSTYKLLLNKKGKYEILVYDNILKYTSAKSPVK